MRTILYLYPESKPSISHKLAGIYAFAHGRDWNLQAIEGELSGKKIKALLAFWQPDGVIVECGAVANPPQTDFFCKTPVVFLDRNPKTIDHPAFCVTHDSSATAQMATKELLSLSLSFYAFVPYVEQRFWSDEREVGFADALKLNGKGYARFNFHNKPNDPLALQSQLGEWLSSLPKPVGIFAANDQMAGEVLAAARHTGISVPGEAAVIGVDNNEMLCENTIPSLSSVVADFVTAGKMAAQMLSERLAKARIKPHTATFGPLRLVRRASTMHTEKSDAEVLAAQDLIRRRACEGLKAREVCALFPCSRRMAEIRFRAATGHSILSEIQDVRRAKAEELLKNPNLDRTAVANFCGYSSANALANFLRRNQR